MFKQSREKKKRGPIIKILIALLVVYVLACFLFLFGTTFISLAEPLRDMGLGWLYFALGGITSAALCFVMSVFMSQQLLFEAKDNELLLAMPVPPGIILGSRMLALMAMQYALELLVAVPLGVVWLLYSPATVSGVLCFVLVFLLLPFLVTTFTTLAGWLLALITGRMRNKTIISIVLMLAFLGVYFYVMTNMQNYLASIITNGAAIAGGVKGYAYPAYALGVAIADGSFASLAGFAGCCLAPFAIAWVILSRSFIGIATQKRGAAHIEYRETALKTDSPATALLKKDLKHFIGNPMYVLNAGLGSVFILVGAVAVFIYRDTLLSVTALMPDYALTGLVAVAICAMCVMDFISAPSVSLEGSNLWIARSIPVPTRTILMAKVNMHILISLPPSLIAAVCCCVALPIPALDRVGVILLPTVLTVFCALLGVWANLHFPRFDYISETMVVKQSASVMIAMFTGMAAVGVPVLLYILLLSKSLSIGLFLLICTAFFAALSAAMYLWLGKGGAKLFDNFNA